MNTSRRRNSKTWPTGSPATPAISREAELLGEFTIEEAVGMGAFFDDLDKQVAFNWAVEARSLRYSD